MLRLTLPITETESESLQKLYMDGAWTRNEIRKHFSVPRLNELTEHEYVSIVPTEMGSMYYLAAKGRKAGFGLANDPRRVSSQINRAYLRLCAQDYGWTPASETNDPNYLEFHPHGHGMQY